MRIIHLSDLHFGTEDPRVVMQLQDALNGLRPAMTIVSGDFTQIGSRAEFTLARHFLSHLPGDRLCVPGNHDVPARNLYQRFFHPYLKYRHYIAPELDGTFENGDVLVAGINSARRCLPHWNWANGAVSEAQRAFLRDTFRPDEPRWTILAMHHPIHKVTEMPIDVTVFGRKRTMQAVHDLKVDLVLTGHVHYASLTTIGDQDHQTVYLSASTALSSRLRGQENGFNVIDVDADHMLIRSFVLKDKRFKPTMTYEHRRLSR
jgi:3',5'-cyclic AMP phosphodiesterase CpdA